MKNTKKLLSIVSTLMLAVTVVEASWPCTFIFYQPKEPASVKALRKL